MGIIWTIIIGFLAGLIARWIHPGVSNEPSGFVLTTLLGIAGAFVATYLGQAIGWYKAGKRWAHRSSRRRNHSVSGVGLFRTSASLILAWRQCVNGCVRIALAPGDRKVGQRPEQIRTK